MMPYVSPAREMCLNALLINSSVDAWLTFFITQSLNLNLQMSYHFIEAQKARSGRSTCRGCGTIIEKGVLRISASYEEDHYQSHPWHHAQCFKKIPKRHEDLKPQQIVGYPVLSKKDKETVEKILEECQNALKQKRPKTKGKSKKRQNSSESEEKPKKPAKSKKSKSTKKQKVKNPGYTTKQRKQFEQYCEDYGDFTIQALKAILALNDQPRTGTKTDLVEKCADGKLLGAIPKCTQCGGGKLRFNNETGQYKCPGYMEDDEFKNCSRKFARDEIQRRAWKQS